VEFVQLKLNLIKMSQQNYKLLKRVAERKPYKYIYEVVDEGNEVVYVKNSNRELVAMSLDGEFSFTKVDLVNKGEHGLTVKWRETNGLKPIPVAYL